MPVIDEAIYPDNISEVLTDTFLSPIFIKRCKENKASANALSFKLNPPKATELYRQFIASDAVERLDNLADTLVRKAQILALGPGGRHIENWRTLLIQVSMDVDSYLHRLLTDFYKCADFVSFHARRKREDTNRRAHGRDTENACSIASVEMQSGLLSNTSPTKGLSRATSTATRTVGTSRELDTPHQYKR